jgi:membrane protease YdiL (CAAX protease family)
MVFAYILVAAISPPLVAKLAPGGTADGARAAAGTAVAIFVVGILAGLVEEPGWRGYALDRLQTLYLALVASLVLGVIWALWHLPLLFIEGTYQNLLGRGSWQFWLFFVAIVPGSVVSAWIYNNTSRSVLAVILLHSCGNAVSELLSLEGTEQVAAFVGGLALAIVVTVMWGASTLSRSSPRSGPRT